MEKLPDPPFKGAVGPFPVQVYITPRACRSLVETVFDKGFDCENCEYRRDFVEHERLSGRPLAVIQEYGCGLLDNEVSDDTGDCPGLERALNRAVLDSIEDRIGFAEVAIIDGTSGELVK